MKADWQEVVDDFLMGCRGGLEPKSVAYYEAQLRLLVAWCQAEGIDLPDFRAKHMRRYLAHRSENGGRTSGGNGVSQKTRRHDVLCAKQLFHFATLEHYIDEDPMKGYPLPKIPKKSYVKTPSDEELKRLMRAVGDRWDVEKNPGARFKSPEQRAFWEARDAAILSALIATGARIGEILALTLENYQPELHRIVIPVAKDDEPRTVPITEAWIAAVRRWQRHRRGRVKRWMKQTDRLFVGWRGEAMTPDSFGKTFRRYRDFGELAGFSLHGMKHYAGTAMFEVSPRMASVITGTSVRTLEIHYVSNNADYVRDEFMKADPLAKIMRKGIPPK